MCREAKKMEHVGIDIKVEQRIFRFFGEIDPKSLE